MTISRKIAQSIFYLLTLAALLGRAVTQVVSHDENQFIAAGQMIAHQGWLPYRDFPYTHMPYGAFLYALSASLSPFQYLAARFLGSLTWMGCVLLMAMIFRQIASRESPGSVAQVSWTYLLGEFALILVFLYHPISSYVLGAALNHSFSTFFSLLAFLFFLSAVTKRVSFRAGAFWSGLCVSIAACVRLNYASLVITLLIVWALYFFTTEPLGFTKWFLPFLGGVLLAALPALVLLALSPAHFYYANLVYIQLNTLYYQGILFKQTMDLTSKIRAFLDAVIHSPIDLVLYLISTGSGIAFLLRAIRVKSWMDWVGLAAAAFAAALFLSAFSPTPTQAHYFFAPLPFMLIMLSVLGAAVYCRSSWAYAAASVLLLAALSLSTSVSQAITQLTALAHPSAWTPVQVHGFAKSLGAQYHVPPGRILTLLPMLTDEVGYTPYPFTVTGPFSWRTSLLLSPSRRAIYGVTSPQELSSLLDAAPPVAILTGLEAPNAGFTFKDLGGLEKPFVEYAQAHGYKPISLSPAFLDQPMTLWVRQP